MAKEFFTDEQVDAEIERLKKSPHVKLARREEAVRNRRRQYMYQLRIPSLLLSEFQPLRWVKIWFYVN